MVKSKPKLHLETSFTKAFSLKCLKYFTGKQVHDLRAISLPSLPLLAVFSDYAFSSNHALDMNNRVVFQLFLFSVCISADEKHSLESSSFYSWWYNLNNEYCKFPKSIKQLSSRFHINHKICQFTAVIHS